MSPRDRRTITLGVEANQILSRLRNQSAYLDSLVRQHAREWTEALALLRSKQWQDEEITAACKALGGYALTAWGRGGAFVARELERAQERSQVFTLHEVVAARRTRLFRQLTEDPSVAWALATLAREYHLPNEDLRSALGEERGAEPTARLNEHSAPPRKRT
jgi:hypothetical protein